MKESATIYESFSSNQPAIVTLLLLATPIERENLSADSSRPVWAEMCYIVLLKFKLPPSSNLDRLISIHLVYLTSRLPLTLVLPLPSSFDHFSVLFLYPR